MKILQILPRVPPAVCGVGDYAWLLARQLRDAHEIHSTFLVAGTSRTPAIGETEFPVHRLPELTSHALVDFVETRAQAYHAVVLHMSPYGFQKRGIPLWLANGWQRISRMPGRPRLLTMFHELYASGPMTSSAFWLQPFQKWALKKIARDSDRLRTNRQAYAGWLHQVSGHNVSALPVFSNLGEPTALPEWQERESAMVVFARGIHSGETVDMLVRKAENLCAHLGLKRLHLIRGNASLAKKTSSVEMVQHGFMDVEDFSCLLLASRMAYSAYSPQHLAKSGLMAAYAAHGLVVITQSDNEFLPDGLRHGDNICCEASIWNAANPATARLETIGEGLLRWYGGHNLKVTASNYADQILDLSKYLQPAGSSRETN